MKPGKPSVNPMKEGRPDPFPEPRTIPTGWDLSEFLDKASDEDQTAYRQEAGLDEEHRENPARL